MPRDARDGALPIVEDIYHTKTKARSSGIKNYIEDHRGDAAHPTSPYAAYGAGMSIEDGYFLARELAAGDVSDPQFVRKALQAYEDRRKPHTARVSQQTYFTGKIFHHTPTFLRPVRDFIFDHTPFLQKVIGDDTPGHFLKQLQEIEDVPAISPAKLALVRPRSDPSTL